MSRDAPALELLVKLKAASVSGVPDHVPTEAHLQLRGVDTFLSGLPALTELLSRASAPRRSERDVWRPACTYMCVCVCVRSSDTGDTQAG